MSTRTIALTVATAQEWKKALGRPPCTMVAGTHLARVLALDNGGYELKYGVAQTISTDAVARVRNVVSVEPGGDRVAGGRAGVVRRNDDGAAAALAHPSPHGYVENVDDATRLWAYAFEQTRLQCFETAVAITVPPRTPRVALEDTVQIFFERFNVPALAVLPTSMSALYGTGRTDGIVLDVGETHTYATPCTEGAPQQYAVQREPLGGSLVTEYFAGHIKGAGTVPWHVAAKAKEALCRVSLCHADTQGGVVYPLGLHEMQGGEEKSVPLVLPDGREISFTMGRDRMMGGELLFRPSYAPHNKDVIPVHEILWNCLQELPFSVARSVKDSVVVCGGTTTIDGFADRLVSEMDCLASTQLKPRLVHPRDRGDLVFKGLCITSCLPQFDPLFVTKDEYNESGPAAAHASYL